MTLDRFRTISNRAIAPFVSIADRLGLSPNEVTVASMGVAVAAIALVIAGNDPSWYLLGGGLVLFNGFLVCSMAPSPAKRTARRWRGISSIT
jgi:archaetidylinositol phosphate synthase